jgi:hypothetical protein
MNNDDEDPGRQGLWRLTEDAGQKDRWHLGGLVTGAGRRLYGLEFLEGKRLTIPQGIVVSLERPGAAQDLTEVFGVPLVSPLFADILRKEAGDKIQLLDAHIAGKDIPLFALNALEHVARADAIRGPALFRIKEWPEALVCGQTIKDAAELAGAHALTFQRLA